MHYIKINSDSPFPPINFETLFPQRFRKQAKFSQKDFLFLLPPDFILLEDGTYLTDKLKCRLSKYWLAKDPDCQADSNRIKNNILSIAASGCYSFFDCPQIKLLESNITNMLSQIPAEIMKLYKEDIDYLLNLFLSGITQNHYKGFQPYHMEKIFLDKLKTLSSRLTCLILIAATWIYWNRTCATHSQPEDQESVKNLAWIILPYHPKNQTLYSDEKLEEFRRKEMEAEKNKAHIRLDEARSNYLTQNFNSAGELCREIIAMGCIDAKDRGEAYYLLVKCWENGFRFQGYYDPKSFKRYAIALGCQQAREEWKIVQLDSLLYQPAPSALTRNTYLIFNTSENNIRVQTFLKSVPESLLRRVPSHISFVSSTTDLLQTVDPIKESTYLFFNDDIDKNFHDFLTLLNKIKTHKIKWKNMKIYLCTNEELYAPLIDTALKHMDGIVLPVFLIDDAKWSAQYLLNHHPIFYPLRSIGKSRLTQGSYQLNINIFGINDDLTKWLIREVFWMGCFIYPGISLHINVFCPEADLLESQLRFQCKSMFGTLPEADNISDVSFSFTNLSSAGFNSAEIYTQLEKLNTQHTHFHYFVINTGSDISNLHLGIQLRKWTISTPLHKGKRIDKIDLPVIAFYCKDPNISHLSESMVVQMEEHGDQWFNNYALIAFGSLSERYIYDQFMSCDYLEKAAQSTHLQYCGISPLATKDEKTKALESYFIRSYNRDSSMGVALSLPYRLFQTSTNDREHIIPTGWNIQNASTYTNSSAISEMTTAFCERNNTSDLLRYEHARWSRWMYSRGWNSANPEMVINYMDSGNPKQQLYIANLHGCLCSLGELEILSDKMLNHYCETGDLRFTRNKERIDFTKIDAENLKQTSEILKTSWFQDK